MNENILAVCTLIFILAGMYETSQAQKARREHAQESYRICLETLKSPEQCFDVLKGTG